MWNSLNCEPLFKHPLNCCSLHWVMGFLNVGVFFILLSAERKDIVNDGGTRLGEGGSG